MNFPLFIARRIYSDKGDKRQVSRPAIRIAMAGVAIGLAVMIIAVCVVVGFKRTIRDKVIGFGSHIQVENLMALATSEQYPVCIDDSMRNVLSKCWGVKSVQKYAFKQGILKTDDDFLGVMFKGIGPDYDLTFLKNNLVSGEYPAFSDEASSNKIAISQQQADKLKLKVGDKVYAYFISHSGVRARKYTVAAIYMTNLSKFDETLCFTDIYAVQKLNGWDADQVSGAELTVEDFGKLDDVEEVLVHKVNRSRDKNGEIFASQTIVESNSQIFSWLDLLDLNIWVILGLMVCVAGITMVSGLLIIILERTSMIGVLKALGARNSSIRHTFLWFGAFIIGKGMIIGNIIAFALMLLQKATGLVKLDPATYYVSEVPIDIDIPYILLINAATLAICVLVLVVPSLLVSHIHPAKSMHFE